MRISQLGDIRCTVGEGPMWDVQTQRLFFVDLVGQKLWRCDANGGHLQSWDMPKPIAGFSYDDGGRAIVVLADGAYILDIVTGRLEMLHRPTLAPDTQLNDVKVDPSGRLVAGSMARDMTSPSAGIFQARVVGWRQLERDFVLFNGPCWSPDGNRFYCSDSNRHVIYEYRYDANGDLSDRRTFADTTTEGMPDGATVDTEGRLWVAMLGSSNIVVYRPDGSIERRLAMPTRWVASVMFGGPKLDRLFVTTLDPSVAGLRGDDGATRVYYVDDVGATGLPEPRIAWR